jgi:uncharacterized protein involved in outer membrane biogenesis
VLARLFVIIGGLVVALLTAVLVVPYFLDWSGYRTDFENAASRITGQVVRVEGGATARLLPFPSITFDNVVIEGVDGLEAGRVAQFSMDAELAPFLSGKVHILDMRIVQPKLTLALDTNGRPRLQLPEAAAIRGASVSIDRVLIEDGELTIAREGREPIVLGALTGTANAKSMAGPWTASGSTRHRDTDYEWSLSTGSSDFGPVRVTFGLEPVDGIYDVAFDGRLATDGVRPVYSGTLRMKLRPAAGQVEVGAARPELFSLQGEFTATADYISLEEATLETAGASAGFGATGSGRVDLSATPSFEIVLKGRQTGEAPAGEASAAAKADRLVTPVTAHDRYVALRDFLRRVPDPGIPGVIKVTLPGAAVGDTIVRDIAIDASPAPGGWQLNAFALELPGRTRIEGAGQLTVSPEFSYAGSLTVASRQPSGLAAWAGVKSGDAIRAMSGAGMAAQVELSETRQRFDALELRAGAMTMTGDAEFQWSDGRVGSMTLKLDGEGADTEVFAALQPLFATDLQNLAGEIAITSGKPRILGQPADRAVIVARRDDGKLTVDDLRIAGFAGADLSLSGTIIEGVAPTGAIDFKLAADDPSALLVVIAAAPGASDIPRFAGAVAATLSAAPDLVAGAKADGKIRVVAREGGRDTEIETEFATPTLTGSATVSLGAGVVRYSAQGNSASGAALLAMAGWPVSGVDLLPALDFTLSGLSSGDGMSADITLSGNGDRLAFSHRRTSSVAGATGTFDAALADATPYALVIGHGIPGGELGLPLAAKGAWGRTADMFSLTEVEGAVGETPVRGTLAIALGAGQPRISGDIEAGDVDIADMLPLIIGATAARDPSQGFAGAPLPGFAADLGVSVESLAGFGPLPLKELTGRLALANGALAISDAKATVAGGALEGAASITRSGDDAILAADATVQGFQLEGAISAAAGFADARFTLNGAGGSLDRIASSLAGSASLGWRNLTVTGLRDDGLEALLEEADAAPDAPDAIASIDLASRHILDGAIAVPDGQASFSVSGGVARAPRLIVATKGGSLAAEPKIDLTTGLVEAAVELELAAGDEAGAGFQPAVAISIDGPWNALEARFDASALEGFLGQRRLEREQARVEAEQSSIMEKQRLRREEQQLAALLARLQVEAAAAAEETRRRAERTAQEALDRAALQAAADAAAEAAEAAKSLESGAGQALDQAPVQSPVQAPGGVGAVPSRPVELNPELLQSPLLQSPGN